MSFIQRVENKYAAITQVLRASATRGQPFSDSFVFLDGRNHLESMPNVSSIHFFLKAIRFVWNIFCLYSDGYV